MTPSIRVSLIGLLLFAVQAAHGHDLWVARERDSYVLYYGHRGEDLLEHAPTEILVAFCFDAGAVHRPAPPAEASPYRFPASGVGCYVLTSSGTWTKTPYGTQPGTRAEAEMAIRSWRSFESTKRIDHWSPLLTKPLTEDLEIVPLNNPLALRPGEKLRLVVVFQGRPVAGARVAYDGEVRGVTDKAGHINIRIRHTGLQMIQASAEQPAEDSDNIDVVIWATTLNFIPEVGP